MPRSRDAEGPREPWLVPVGKGSTRRGWELCDGAPNNAAAVTGFETGAAAAGVAGVVGISPSSDAACNTLLHAETMLACDARNDAPVKTRHLDKHDKKKTTISDQGDVPRDLAAPRGRLAHWTHGIFRGIDGFLDADPASGPENCHVNEQRCATASRAPHYRQKLWLQGSEYGSVIVSKL